MPVLDRALTTRSGFGDGKDGQVESQFNNLRGNTRSQFHNGQATSYIILHTCDENLTKRMFGLLGVERRKVVLRKRDGVSVSNRHVPVARWIVG